ncbi:pyridoxamine 5'-phosphate oxidase family protein [Massilia sp. PAMC28688]|uniref:pyridoxamine 5'-phosphate oxidase family protein n=1 Tax=Massilia sp. PAMC28688 TaxID=2861283 RepID=UPI001C62A98F|nr:pyridoxamine 5'-phosphate oxidase family protein [Massilia sp. PAMC28688]QYF92969.1 pyridoxamine 5'-phosphate oxidase family protein [Massilia sp. PAMC28688]
MSAYDHSSQVAELKSKIKSIRFAMFTTIDEHGHLISRPMTNQETDAQGNLWFYTSTETDLWENIVAHPEVNLSFSEPADHVYVSISGRAERVVERDKIKAMWNSAVQAWYPHGPDDPHVVLIKVVSDTAEYWDSNASSMVQLFKMAKAVLTGTTPDEGEHARINL